MSDKDIKLTDEEINVIDHHMDMLLYGPVYKALGKMFKGYNSRAKEIEQKAHDLKTVHGYFENEQMANYAAVNAIDKLEDKLNLAIKALERIEDFWEVNLTVKTYARDALSKIRRDNP